MSSSTTCSSESSSDDVYRPSEASLLWREADSQLQRALREMHESLLSRQSELRRAQRAAAASAGPHATGSLEQRRLRLADELRHSELMEKRARHRGDEEEVAYRSGQAGQLRLELAGAEAEAEARRTGGDGGNVEDGVSQALLAELFAQAADEFTERLVTDMRVTAEKLADNETRELEALKKIRM